MTGSDKNKPTQKLTIMKKVLFVIMFLVQAKFSIAQWNADPSVNLQLSWGNRGGGNGRGVVKDGNGGFIFMWSNGKVKGQRVDNCGNSSPNSSWPPLDEIPGGKDLVPVSSVQDGIAIIPDGNGNAIIFWYDDRSWGTGEGLYVQKYNPNGDFLWPVGSPDPGGVLVRTSTPEMPTPYPKICSDGLGGAVIGWMTNDGSGPGLQWDIYAQRITAAGINANWGGH